MSIKRRNFYIVVFVLITTLLSFNLYAENQDNKDGEVNTPSTTNTIKSDSIASLSMDTTKNDSILNDSISNRATKPLPKKEALDDIVTYTRRFCL